MKKRRAELHLMEKQKGLRPSTHESRSRHSDRSKGADSGSVDTDVDGVLGYDETCGPPREVLLVLTAVGPENAPLVGTKRRFGR